MTHEEAANQLEQFLKGLGEEKAFEINGMVRIDQVQKLRDAVYGSDVNIFMIGLSLGKKEQEKLRALQLNPDHYIEYKLFFAEKYSKDVFDILNKSVGGNVLKTEKVKAIEEFYSDDKKGDVQ